MWGELAKVRGIDGRLLRRQVHDCMLHTTSMPFEFVSTQIGKKKIHSGCFISRKFELWSSLTICISFTNMFRLIYCPIAELGVIWSWLKDSKALDLNSTILYIVALWRPFLPSEWRSRFANSHRMLNLKNHRSLFCVIFCIFGEVILEVLLHAEMRGHFFYSKFNVIIFLIQFVEWIPT